MDQPIRLNLVPLPGSGELPPSGVSLQRELFDAVEDILYVRDLSGVIVEINEAGARFFGTSREDLIGRTLHRDLDGSEARSLKSTNERLLALGIDRSTVETMSARGELRVLEATTTLMRDSAGRPVGAYGVMRDVTESTVLQRSLAEANDGLLRFARNLSEEKERTEEALRIAEAARGEAERQREIAHRAIAVIEADNARKTSELEDARALQHSMLPDSVPQAEGIDIAVRMRTESEVGGDYYDFARGADGSVIVAIGDATGHGFRAGILVATAKSYFQTLASRLSIGEVMEAMTNGFHGLRLRSVYLCLALLRIERTGAALVSAGMPPFLLRRASGEVVRIDASGMPLGIRGAVVQPEVSFPVGAGDVLLLATDGVDERFDGAGRELGTGRLAAWLAGRTISTADALAEEVMSFADAWGAATRSDDDITVIVIRIE